MSNELRGYVVNPEKIQGKSAYEIAVMHGFDGTEEEWLLSLETNSMESIKKLKAESVEEIEAKKKEATEHIVSLADDVLDVKQTTGNSPTAVMSQEATTREFERLKSETAKMNFNGSNTRFTFGKFIWSNGLEYASEAMAVSDFIIVGGGERLEALHFTDDAGYTMIDFVCEYSTNTGAGFIKRTNIENGGSVILDERTKFIRFSFGRGTETGVVLKESDLSYFNVDMTNFYSGISSAFLQTLHNRMDATADNSMDDLTNFGIYGWTASNAPYDCPVADGGVMMVIQFSNQNNPKYGRMAQILYTVYGEFTRYRTTTAWTEWQLKGALVSGDSIKINALSKKCNTAFTPLADVDATDNKTIPTFIAGTKYKGVPYSARHYDSLDVFYNLSLDALFSMFNSQATAIYHYTKERNTGDVFTGGVCSSFVSWVCNLPIYYTTYDIVKMLNYKTVNTIEDIEIGDVLICHTTFGDNDDHAMIVSNIIADINGVTAIEIAEMWNPLFRRIIYEPHRFMGLLEGTTRKNQKYRVGRFDNHSIRTVKSPVINSELMSEYGNNVYYELGDDIFVTYASYKLLLTSPSGEVYDTDDLTIDYETKNDGLYNIGRWFNEVGTWKVTPPEGDSCNEVLNIRIIKKGSATLANGRVALSGYEGCAPCGYAVVGIRKGGDGNYDTHLDDTSYTAGRLTIYSKNDPRYAGVLANDTLQFNLDMSAVGSPYVGYYVRVFYETGYGQAFQDTNIQYF